MKKRISVFIAAALVCAFVLPPVAHAAVSEITELFQVKHIELSKKGSSISAKGKRPVVVKDKLRVTKSLRVLGPLHATAIHMAEGGTVDGVDISVLSTTVDALNVQIASKAELPECDNGEVLKVADGEWSCGADLDTDTDTNTIYTAGDNIEIVDGVISSTVEGATYTAGTGIEINEGEISSTVEGLQECSNGQIIRQNGGEWTCVDYQSYDSYDNVLVVAKSGAGYSTINAAINRINTNGDAAADNQYVVWVGAGEYEEKITIPDYVHVVGVHKDAVELSSTDSTFAAPLVQAGTESSLSNVTLVASSSSFATHAVVVNDSDTFVLENVSVTASSDSGSTIAINALGDIVLEKVTVYASNTSGYGYALNQDSSNVIVKESSLIAGGSATVNAINMSVGSSSTLTVERSNIETENSTNCVSIFQTVSSSVINISDSVIHTNQATCSSDDRALHSQDSASVSVRNSVLSAATAITHGLSSVVGVATSEVDGPVGGDATLTCVHSYDGSFAALDTTCN